MSWSQLTVVVDDAQREAVIDMMEAFFAQAVTCENAGEDEFYEVAFPGTPDWHKVRVTGLYDDNIELQPIVEFIQQQVNNQHADEIPIEVSHLIDQDWQRVWLDSFKPIKVGNNLWICPSWCEPVDASARNLILDPGLAFGTGTHATTALCLTWLAEQQLQGQHVLDYGCGSGILGIAALLADAETAHCVDIDPLAVEATQQNAERNQVTDRCVASLPNNSSLDATQQYDLVIANILAEVIINLRDTLLSHLKPNGTLLLTGILEQQAEQVTAAFASECDFVQHNQDQWCLLIGQRR